MRSWKTTQQNSNPPRCFNLHLAGKIIAWVQWTPFDGAKLSCFLAGSSPLEVKFYLGESSGRGCDISGLMY